MPLKVAYLWQFGFFFSAAPTAQNIGWKIKNSFGIDSYFLQKIVAPLKRC
jgi:hypothetical protein